MTDEQIKQNAIKAATEFKDWHHPQMSFYDGYIAGAHSRDDEIEELQKDVHDLEQALSFAEDVVDIQRKELDKLRNPWISVEDRLHGKARGLYKLEEDEQHKHVLFRTRNGLTFSGYLDAEEIWRDERSIPVDFITPSPVTNWMEIPILKGGKV